MVLCRKGPSGRPRIEMYRSEDSVGGQQPVRMIDLETVRSVQPVERKKSFLIELPEETMMLQCTSKADMEDWVRDTNRLRGGRVDLASGQDIGGQPSGHDIYESRGKIKFCCMKSQNVCVDTLNECEGCKDLLLNVVFRAHRRVCVVCRRAYGENTPSERWLKVFISHLYQQPHCLPVLFSTLVAMLAVVPDDETFRVRLRKSSTVNFSGSCLLEIQRNFDRNLFHIALFTESDSPRLIVRWQIDHIRQYGSNNLAFKFQSGRSASHTTPPLTEVETVCSLSHLQQVVHWCGLVYCGH
jgi:hypothetical protein